jgi:hypothetical protein
MAQRPVLVFLAKVVPLIVLLLVLWEELGFSRPYHNLLAGVLGVVYPRVDPTGAVTRVGVRDNQFYFTLIVGEERVGLSVNASDITSNTSMLLALYLASPIRRRTKQFLGFLACALVLLFVWHAVTVVTVSQEALMTHPGVMASAPFSSTQVILVPRYNVFAEEMGMYLSVLLLWFPYIAWCIFGRSST